MSFAEKDTLKKLPKNVTYGERYIAVDFIIINYNYLTLGVPGTFVRFVRFQHIPGRFLTIPRTVFKTLPNIYDGALL